MSEPSDPTAQIAQVAVFQIDRRSTMPLPLESGTSPPSSRKRLVLPAPFAPVMTVRCPARYRG